MRSAQEKLRELASAFMHEHGLPGLAVVVTAGGESLLEEGLGLARLNPQRPVTPDTIMSIQSITKSFASASIMHLVEKGAIELDRPVVTYLPYFRTADPAASDRITVRQLLSHTAGFPTGVGVANLICLNRHVFPQVLNWARELGITEETLSSIHSREDIVRYFANIELAYEPGTDFIYCTDAYAIVGDLFDKVSSERWEDHVRRCILEPLHMDRTTFDAAAVQADADAARYYDFGEGETTPVEVPFPTNPVASPIGFLYSTAVDMTKYLSAYMDPDDSPILEPASIRELQTPVGRMDDEIQYGLGWMVGHIDGLRFVGHGGGYFGVSAFVGMVPEEELEVVTLTNRGGVKLADLDRQMVQTVLGRPSD